MNNIIEYCLTKKGAVKDFPFGSDILVIKVAGKMFALIFENRHTINLKCDPVIAENLREQHENVQPGYHMNKKHWNTVLINESMNESDVFPMIDHSYDLVFSKLPKSTREAILMRI